LWSKTTAWEYLRNQYLFIMKTILVFLCCCVIIIPQSIGQKCFNAGSFVISANAGIDGNFANRRFINSPEGPAQTLNGMAPASIYSLSAEYGLFRWLGIGAIGRLDDYYLENNTLTSSTATAGAIGIGGTANIHVLKTKHFDLFAGYDLGFSEIRYYTHDGANATSVADGSWSDIHVTGRIYLGRLGFNASVYVPGTTYSNFKSSNMDAGQYALSYWKSTGYGASVGLEYRLF